MQTDYTDEQLAAGLKCVEIWRNQNGVLSDESLCGMIFDAMRAAEPDKDKRIAELEAKLRQACDDRAELEACLHMTVMDTAPAQAEPMREALQKIDRIAQVLLEGGYGDAGNKKAYREIAGLAQTWLKAAAPAQAEQREHKFVKGRLSTGEQATYCAHCMKKKAVAGPHCAAPAQAEPSDDARDAARYRWLRMNNIVANVRFHFANGESPYVYAEELDKAIDHNMDA